MEKEFELTNENYHSVEARKLYMGASQFKDFLKCPKEALAKINGELEEKSTTALMVGSYVDAYFSNEMSEFITQHPEVFTKQGVLKSEFQSAEQIIKCIESDEMMMKYLSGEHQVIMTGFISGVPFKIKMDSYHRNKLIVDQKIMRDLEPVWIETEDGHRTQTDFVQAYRYDIQGAIYQEIERQVHLQETGEDRKLPFVLAVTTKEEYPDKILLKIDQEYLDIALEEVKSKAPLFESMKQGKILPTGCGKCAACKKDKKVKGVLSYQKVFIDKDI